MKSFSFAKSVAKRSFLKTLASKRYFWTTDDNNGQPEQLLKFVQANSPQAFGNGQKKKIQLATFSDQEKYPNLALIYFLGRLESIHFWSDFILLYHIN